MMIALMASAVACRAGKPTDVPGATPIPSTSPVVPTPGSIDSARLEGASLIHWQEGRPESGNLVVRDRTGMILAAWRAPAGLGVGSGTVTRDVDLAQALSPDGRWLAFVTGDAMEKELRQLPDRPATLVVVDLSDGQTRFTQPLLGEEALTGLRATSEAALRKRHGYKPDMRLPWEVASEPDTRPVPTAADDLMGPWVVEEVVEGFNAGLGKLVWSPDSRRLAVIAAVDRPSSDVYLLDVDGWRWWLPVADPGQPGAVYWRPDGTQLLVLGTGPMRRDSGDPVVEGAWQIDPDQQAISGQWDYKTGGPVDAMLQGWTLGGQAIVTEFNHGCGICGLWRLDPPASMSSPFSQRTAFDSLVAMPSGDWVAISGAGPAVADSSPHGTALPPSSDAAESRGTFLLDIARLRLAPVDPQTGPLAYWGAEGLPFVETGGATGMVAIGPGQRRELPRLGGRNVSVSLGDRWRVIHGPGGLWFFDDQSRLRGSWTEASVLDVAWSPSADRLLWLAGTSLWQMAVPDGAAVRLSDWHRTERPGYAAQALRLSLGWLAR